ncbi:cdc42 effector protein 1 [Esox lucius]|uniref:CRIB domain-containing protein n=1 Tax=Esox lucius TaxID=8010 RepID=A0AAY5L1Q6_ESOLU|nr:cdc42 effector protein 1 [Esox lucius]XP_010893849.1 cdc42 effector protein 1 [Esox lucius]XP_010893851.1 cdc42 effector protein 1 [Esox lucius]
MNLGKIPGLKGLVTGSQGRRRFKGDLTLDMISPPLGDFRHTMHVGRGGDVFGDTSFLSNHGGSANGDADSVTSPDNKIGAFFSRTLRHVRKTPERPRGGSKDLSPPPPPISPIVKNAVSLPRLDVDSPNGCPVKNLFPASPTSLEETTYGYGLESGFITLPRLSRSAEHQSQQRGSTSCTLNTHGVSFTDILSSSTDPAPTSEPGNMTRSNSLNSMASFIFDLGPSLMSEVFGVIDSPSDHPEPIHSWEEEEPSGSAFGFATNEGSEMDSEMDATTASLVDSLLREDCSSSRKSPYGMEWEEEEEEARKNEVNGVEQHPKGAVPDLVMGSPSRQRPAMDSEKFLGATDVLGILYGVGGLLKGQQRMDLGEEVTMGQTTKKTPYVCITSDEEEEIKV